MAKDIKFDIEARDGLKRGVDYKRDENVNLQKPLFNPNTFTENYSKSTENYSMKNEIIIGEKKEEYVPKSKASIKNICIMISPKNHNIFFSSKIILFANVDSILLLYYSLQ
mgnify:CR=1 FL=1